MNRFITMGLVSAAVILLGGYLIDWTWRNRALENGERNLSEHAQFVSSALERLLTLRMTQVFTFAALPSVRGYAAADPETRPARGATAYTELQAIVAADPNVRAASILDTAGIVSLTTDKSMLANWGERAFAREALRGQLYASPPALDFGDQVQYYSAPIIDNGGNVSGVLVLRVTAQEWWSGLAGQSNVRVVDEYGVRIAERTTTPLTFSALVPINASVKAQLLAEKRYGSELTQINATNLKSLADVVNSGSNWKVLYREMDGRPARAVIQRLKNFPWSVIVFEYDEVFLSPVEEAWRMVMMLGLVVFVVVGVDGWMVFTRRQVN